MSGKDKALDWGELERIAREATPGPWEPWDSLYEGMKAAIVSPGFDPLKTVAEVRSCFGDAVFIATFNPSTVLRLLQERRELVEALKEERTARASAENMAQRLYEQNGGDTAARAALDVVRHVFSTVHIDEVASITLADLARIDAALSRSTSSPEDEEVIPGVGP